MTEAVKQSKGSDPVVFRCSLYFGFFAICVAGLLGLGHKSMNLPLLVTVSVVLGLVYTDWLGWFSLNRFFVYVLMISGAIFAILQYMTTPGSDRLLSVGNLLVFVQLPLVFQVKVKRVFEQWGVFLLLELVVAALVNDDVLFGILMAPALVVGCAAMVWLAHYSSVLRHSDSRTESTSWLSRWFRWFGTEPLLAKRSLEIKLSCEASHVTTGYSGLLGGWGAVVIPITVSVFVFSAAYFYALPRMHVGAYQSSSLGSASVGFAERVSLKYQGSIQQNESPAFRMVMYDERKEKEFRPIVPPYIRMAVLHRYFAGPAHGEWQRSESSLISNPRVNRRIPVREEMIDEIQDECDSILVSISEKANFGGAVASIPPFSKSNSIDSFIAIRRDWRMVDSEYDVSTKPNKRRYSFRSYGFANGNEKSLLPDMQDCLNVEPLVFQDTVRQYSRSELTEFPSSLNSIIAFRDSLLDNSARAGMDKFSQAKFLENHLATSPDFQYTLRNTPQVDESMDPIADFLLNKKKGHCEYYASALAMLLRSMNIPARLVSGYRPSEYNEIGKYFPVQQKHAHVWVEAYFTVEELKERTMGEPVPSWVKHGLWARFDPTPSGENTNGLDAFRTSGGQTFGMMQELWSELVMNIDRSRQSNMFSLFGETSEDSYSEYWDRFKQLVDSIRSSKLLDTLLSPETWFSWRAALGITLLGTSVVVVYRLLLWCFPNLFPKRSSRKKRRSRTTNVEFYNRLNKSLSRLGISRQAWETPKEFLTHASEALGLRGIAFRGELLADWFYDVRFGATSLSDANQAIILEQLTLLEKASRRPKV